MAVKDWSDDSSAMRSWFHFLESVTLCFEYNVLNVCRTLESLLQFIIASNQVDLLIVVPVLCTSWTRRRHFSIRCSRWIQQDRVWRQGCPGSLSTPSWSAKQTNIIGKHDHRLRVPWKAHSQTYTLPWTLCRPFGCHVESAHRGSACQEKRKVAPTPLSSSKWASYLWARLTGRKDYVSSILDAVSSRYLILWPQSKE